MSLFTGSGVALVTPFKDNKVNYEMLEYLINFHINNHTDAIIVCGTTGEAATLSWEEKVKIYQFSVDVAKRKVPIIAGTGSANTAETIKLSQYAKKAGCDGILVITPYYNKPSQAGLISHYQKIAEAVDIPMIIYNVPSRTGVDLNHQTIKQLSKIKNIVGIKEASGDISKAVRIRAECQTLDLYAGNDDQIIPILSIGGKGVISVTANILPRQIHQLIFKYLAGESDAACQEFLKLRKLNAAMFLETNPVPVKTTLNLMGIDVGSFRLPLVDMDKDNLEKLKLILNSYELVSK